MNMWKTTLFLTFLGFFSGIPEKAYSMEEKEEFSNPKTIHEKNDQYRLKLDKEKKGFYIGKSLSEVALSGKLPKECSVPYKEIDGGVVFFLDVPISKKKSHVNLQKTKSRRSNKFLPREKQEDEHKKGEDVSKPQESLLVKGEDRRSRVPCSYKYPECTNGHMRMHFHKGTDLQDSSIYIGTGTLIDGKYVITAGHNLYDPEYDQVAQKIVFQPGRDLQNVYWTSYVDMIVIHKHWYQQGDEESDIGLMRLKSSLGHQVGHLALADINTLGQMQDVNITGFPGNPGNGKEMYTMTGSITTIEKNKIYYNIDTSPGQSGSGIFYKNNNKYMCVGVHTNGGSLPKGNSGIIINKERITKIEEWKKELKRISKERRSFSNSENENSNSENEKDNRKRKR